LNPFAVEDKLRDSALAYVGENEINGSRGGFNIDFFVGDAMGFEEALCFAAISAPEGGVDGKIHRFIILSGQFWVELKEIDMISYEAIVHGS
jgi:hypothetical protein